MVALSDEVQKLIEERMKRGHYSSAEDVVRAGLAILEQLEEMVSDFAPGELDALIAEGEADIAAGRVHDGEEVFREIEQLSAARRREQAK